VRSGIHPRLAEPADGPAVETLVREAYSPYVARIGREPAPMTTDYAPAITAGQVWIVRSDDDLAGVIVLIPAPNHLLVENLAVRPDHQGQGIGSRLLAHADEQARLMGFGEVRLYTNAAMTENLEYYPRQGFRETHRAIDAGFARVFFTKTL
jgi:GNAT superfamily N-acetyltransferase